MPPAALPAAPTPRSAAAPARARARLRGGLRALRVAVRMGMILVREAAARPIDRVHSPAHRTRRRARRRVRAATSLARTLGALGGPYVKAGQLAALRVDVLEPDVRAALGTLYDRAPAIPVAAVRAVLEAELGGPVSAHFAELDPTPLATASIAQVHAARLPDGTPVAVKVVRPGLESTLDADLRWAGRAWRLLAARERPPVPGGAALFEEFARRVREELDLEREARNAGEVAERLADEAHIVVPRVFPSHSTARVLTMARTPALRIDDRDALARRGVDRERVARLLVRAYARQVFEHGVFHADPHPGNLFVLDEPGMASSPRLLFVDFGLCERLAPATRAALRRAGHALLRRDAAGVAAALDALGAVAPGARPAVEVAVREGLDGLSAGGAPILAMDTPAALDAAERAKALLGRTPGLALPPALLLTAKTLLFTVRLSRELAPALDATRELLPWALRFLASDAPAGADVRR